MAMSGWNPVGGIGVDNMKENLGLVALFLLVYYPVSLFIHQPKNIFDEIYQETARIIWAIITKGT